MVNCPSTVLIFILTVFTLTSSTHHHHSSKRHHFHLEYLHNEIPEEEDRRLALLHSQRVSEASACDVPKQQVIHINDHYPGKYYLPHCTLLHRCGKHTGCCGAKSLKCVAAEKEKVILHFFSVEFSGDELVERKVEKLVFTNHTKCACASVRQLQKHDL